MIPPDAKVIGHRRVRVGEPYPEPEYGGRQLITGYDYALMLGEQAKINSDRKRHAAMWSAVVAFSEGGGCLPKGNREKRTSDSLIESEGRSGGIRMIYDPLFDRTYVFDSDGKPLADAHPAMAEEPSNELVTESSTSSKDLSTITNYRHDDPVFDENWELPKLQPKSPFINPVRQEAVFDADMHANWPSVALTPAITWRRIGRPNAVQFRVRIPDDYMKLDGPAIDWNPEPLPCPPIGHLSEDAKRRVMHSPDCGWHTDQYPWECDCGVGAGPPPGIVRCIYDIAVDAFVRVSGQAHPRITVDISEHAWRVLAKVSPGGDLCIPCTMGLTELHQLATIAGQLDEARANP